MGQTNTGDTPPKGGSAKAPRRRRVSTGPAVPVVRLHEQDIERIVSALLEALRRERLVDDVARFVRKRMQLSQEE